MRNKTPVSVVTMSAHVSEPSSADRLPFCYLITFTSHLVGYGLVTTVYILSSLVYSLYVCVENTY